MKIKKKILILFKSPWNWNKFIINKLSKFYTVDHMYVNSIENKNFTETVNEINKTINKNNIEIVFFEVDYYKFINLYFINKIKGVKKVLMTMDDYDLHEKNAITASACDLVVSGCPFSAKKYMEKGYQAFFMTLEADADIYKNHQEKKEIDVLFFGGLNQDRNNFLKFIENEGISVKIVGHQSGNFVSDEELSKLISKSKIVLNLSKNTWGAVKTYSSNQLLNPDKIFEFNYMLKGRVYLSGLCGTMCVSEYFPAHDMIFDENEMPVFFTKEECVAILKKLLKNEELLTQCANKFSAKVYDKCEDKKNFQPIYNELEKLNHRKVKLLNIPFWYKRIAAKQIILRNMRLSSIIKVIFEFKMIFEIIKNSNLLIKFLIIFESMINILWNLFRSFFKSKKF